MQTLICPECGHPSTYDPRVEQAQCPRCGFTPPTGENKKDHIRRMQGQGYEGFLKTLLSHWRGRHVPDSTFSLPTFADAQAFYQAYRDALGAPSPHLGSKDQMITTSATAYAHLEHGEMEQAKEPFRLLITRAPHLADVWVWLTVLAEDPANRQTYLETALRHEPGHPLARDALGFARCETPYPGEELEDRIALLKCPQCGGELPFLPGTPGKYQSVYGDDDSGLTYLAQVPVHRK